MRLAFIAAVAAGALLLLVVDAERADASAIIDNGVIQLGVLNEGALNLGGGSASCGGVSIVGIRYMATGCEATAPGCACEGWGASYDGTVSGACNVSVGGCPAGSLSGCTFTSGADWAKSVCKISQLEVTHEYKPSPTPELYQVIVTLKNTGTTTIDPVKYRRAMDWDVEPTPFSEIVTIDGITPMPAVVEYFSDDGFSNPDPLVGAGGMIGGCGPTTTYFTDCGPSDHGSVFTFNFGRLVGGDQRQFNTYYGAAANETNALAAISAENLELWSLGQTNSGGTTGTPNTFIFGFNGLNVRADVDWDADLYCESDPVTFLDNSTVPLSAVWNYWDISINTTPPTTFSYGSPPAMVVWSPPGPGVYKVDLRISVNVGPQLLISNKTESLTVEGCPVADFACNALTHPDWLDVRFDDRSIDPDVNLKWWEWDFGDGTTHNGSSPGIHKYPAEGMYKVHLRIVDDHQIEAEAEHWCFADNNLPPVIDVPDKIIVFEGDKITFTTSASDPDDDPIYSAWDGSSVPRSARYNLGTSTFSWQTYKGQAGLYGPVDFIARDPYWETVEGVMILVAPMGGFPQPENADADGDGVADAVDDCLEDIACDLETFAGFLHDPVPVTTKTSEPPPDPDVPPTDVDGDGIMDGGDNCVHTPNGAQADLDGDGIGDLCDPDVDGDYVMNVDGAGRPLDNCVWTPNPLQEDADGDGIGDICQGDVDLDGVLDGDDNCMWVPNPLQTDLDGDGVGDACEGNVFPWERDLRTNQDDNPPPATSAAASLPWAWLGGGLALGLLGLLLVLLLVRRKSRS